MSEETHLKEWYVAQVVVLTNERNRLRNELEAIKQPTIGQAVKLLVKAVVRKVRGE